MHVVRYAVLCTSSGSTGFGGEGNCCMPPCFRLGGGSFCVVGTGGLCPGGVGSGPPCVGCTMTWLSGSSYTYEKNNVRLNHSYTMVCPPVRGDNPLALASGFFIYCTGGRTVVYLSYTTLISVGLAPGLPLIIHFKIP